MNDPKISVGIDIEETLRFRRKPLKANKSLYNSIFTESELSYCGRYSDPYPHLTGIFAAKEAVIKCSNQQRLRIKDIEIVRTRDGKPTVVTPYNKNNSADISISISHTRSLATAVAVIMY
jgi:holo-[acyl-carrier protein] synthase